MAPSAQIRLLSGQPATGPSAMYLRFVRQSIPMHLHTADYHLLVVEGTMKHWSRGESEADARPLGPGSYWYQPGGQAHADACVSDSCLLYLVWSGPRDGRPAPAEAPR
jgi:quercetin dioxygenase-like cupin family protein